MDAICRNVWLPKTEGTIDSIRTTCGDCAPRAAQTAADSALAGWIGEIRRTWARGAADTLELARVVSAARDQLPRGAWNSFWKQPSPMPFSRRHGYHLVAIGHGLHWANVHVCAHLPRGLRVLCHLAKLDRVAIETAIEQGLILPGIKESEAKALVARFHGQLAAVASRPFNVRQRLKPQKCTTGAVIL